MARLLGKLFGKTTTIRNAPKPTPRTQLGLEGLEGRLVPATVSFDPTQSLLQLSGQVTYVNSTGTSLAIDLGANDSLSASAVNSLNAAAGRPSAFVYNAAFGILLADTSTVRNVTVTDTGNDLVGIDSTTLPGNLTVTAGAVYLEPGAVVNVQGSVQLTGLGTAPMPDGVDISNGAKVVAGGSVVINGTGSNAATPNNAGVRVNSGTVAAGGSVSITGQGRGTGNNEDGIDLWNGATVSAAGSGTVTLNGYGSTTARDGNFGVCISTSPNSSWMALTAPAGAHTQVSAQNGSVTVNGTGGGTGQWNYGVAVSNNGVVQATGTGSVYVTGHGSFGTNWDEGIVVASNGAVTTTSGSNMLRGYGGSGSGYGNNGIDIHGGAVQSGSGNLSLYGYGSGTGNGNSGVAIYGGGTVKGAAVATITVTGYGSGTGTYDNDGVYVNGAGTRIDAAYVLNLSGGGGGSGPHNYGVMISGGAAVDGGLYANIYGGPGADSIDLSASTATPAAVNGNDGDDTIIGGPGNDTLRGGSGNDVIRGGAGDDDLYGGDGNDVLYGNAGNDGLYGGMGSDTLTGGSGSTHILTLTLPEPVSTKGKDRFLVLKDEPVAGGGVTNDLIADQNTTDAKIDFFNGPQLPVTFGGQIGTYTYSAGSFTSAEIEQLDKAFSILEHKTHNTKLLKKVDGSDLQFERQGTLLSATGPFSAGAWNDGTRIHLIDVSFGSDAAVEGYIVHEVGHNFDNVGENPSIGTFRALSGWTNTNPNSALYTAASGNAAGGEQWWYANTAQMVTNYARTNPYEDFADSFRAYMGVGADPSTAPQKMAYMDSFIAWAAAAE